MKRFTTKLSTGLASLALVLAASGVASAQFASEAPKSVAMVGGVWVTPLKANSTAEGFLAFKFQDDGSVAVFKLDSQAKPVGVKKGTYSVTSDTIQITLEGKTFGLKYSVVNANKLMLDGLPCVRVN